MIFPAAIFKDPPVSHPESPSLSMHYPYHAGDFLAVLDRIVDFENDESFIRGSGSDLPMVCNGLAELMRIPNTLPRKPHQAALLIHLDALRHPPPTLSILHA